MAISYTKKYQIEKTNLAMSNKNKIVTKEK